jgi:hypothetical protein
MKCLSGELFGEGRVTTDGIWKARRCVADRFVRSTCDWLRIPLENEVITGLLLPTSHGIWLAVR